VAPEFFPRPYRAEVEEAARAAGIDPVWIWAIMRQESRFNPVARSAALAGGAMQLLGTTAARVAAIAGIGAVDRDSPAQAIQVAAWYLRALSDRFRGEFALVAAAYNAGPEAVSDWMAIQGQRRLDVFVEQIPFRETRSYVKEVLANAAAYRSLFGPPGSLVEPSLPLPAPFAAGASF
jgi:soluble lytic murein transglycosylase